MVESSNSSPVRNSGLVLFAGWLAAVGRAKDAERLVKEEEQQPPPARRAAGFSLIEILVVIFIVGVLLAIIIPALGKARAQGRVVEALSAHRQSLAGLTMYADASRGFLPFLGAPGHPEKGALPQREWGGGGAPSFFRGQSQFWPTALLGHGIDLAPAIRSDREFDDPDLIHTYMWLTHTAFARPEYWVGVDPPPSRSLFSGVRLDEAVYPSSKGLIVDLGLLDRDSTSWTVGFVDGSAASKSVHNPPVDLPDLGRPYGAVAWRVLTTPEGMRGQDY